MKKSMKPKKPTINTSIVTKNPAITIAAIGAACYAGSYLAPNDSDLQDKLRIGGALVVGVGVGAFATQILNSDTSAEKSTLIDQQNAALKTQANILASIAKISGVSNTVQTQTKAST